MEIRFCMICKNYHEKGLCETDVASQRSDESPHSTDAHEYVVFIRGIHPDDFTDYMAPQYIEGRDYDLFVKDTDPSITAKDSQCQ